MIDVTDEGGLRLVRLARPDKANALTRDMLERVADAASGAAAAGAKALILTAEGKVFSAGADLAAAAAGLATEPVWDRASAAIAAFPGFSIAALNGTLAGGAFGIALACDCRISVPGAQFFYPVMRLGYRPQPADPARLRALIGPARAKMILVGGQRIAAAEALSWGLIDRITGPDDDILQAARTLCTDALAATAAHGAAVRAMV